MTVRKPYASTLHHLALYVLESVYSIQSIEEFYHYIQAVNAIQDLPVAIEIDSRRLYPAKTFTGVSVN